MAPDPVIVCVDAGATRSRGRLYDPTGKALGSAEGGPANASYDRDQAVASVTDLWRRLAAGAGRDPERRSAAILAVGGAGLYIVKACEAFVAGLPGFAEIVTMSDGYAAMIGAGRGAPCGLVTIGTGVAGHRLFADGTSVQRDAWGWIVGDRGGGCWIGTRAVRHAAEVLDGLAEGSALSDAVMARVGGMPGLLCGALANLTGQKLAAFAPLVLEAQRAGCPVAGGIVARAVGHLDALVGALDCDDVPLYLNGGLADALGPRLAIHRDQVPPPPWGDAMAGCLLVAQAKAPRERVVLR